MKLKEVTITYRRRRIPGWELTKGVVFDRGGNFYLLSWKEPSEKKYKTPFQRIKKGWRKTERRWKKFPQGLNSLIRGLFQAIWDGKLERIPTIEELKNICQEAKIEILSLRSMTKEEISHFRRERLLKSFEILKKARKPSLKEAKNQLLFCLPLRDSLGRINIVVIRARLGAVERRYEERLEGIYSWLPVYLARLEILQNLRKEIYQTFQGMKKNLKSDILHEAFQKG